MTKEKYEELLLETGKNGWRLIRNTALAETDWTQLKDVTLSVPDQEGWDTYRQELRDCISDITADCKGNCACGTCHVHIDEKWVDIIEPIYLASLEPYLLEKSKQYNKKLSRLCCQVEIKNEYDGLIVHLLES